MIEKWFNNRVRSLIDGHHRLVITDTRGKGAFLLDLLPPRRYMVLSASTPIDELRVKIETERDYADKNVIFYTTIAKADLTSLQEYAVTCGCIVLDDMEAFIKNVLYQELGINSQVDGRTLLFAAKMGKGKDENWWRAVAQGITNPLNPEDLILKFLKAPVDYARLTDGDIFKIMQEEACHLAGKPVTEQAPQVLATEVMNAMLSQLVTGTISEKFLEIYYKMADSEEMSEPLLLYISDFTLPHNLDPLQTHPDHPFVEVDRMAFRRLSQLLRLGENTEGVLDYIQKRLASDKAKRFKPRWLNEVKVLLKFNLGTPHLITSLDDFAVYYRDTFARLDTAMRRIYVQWLNEPDVLRPIQEKYEQFNKSMLEHWFELSSNYQQTQQGILAKTFQQNQGKTAIIVCDGLRLEMAHAVSLKKYSAITRTCDMAWSKLPSVTPNGMSALYGLDSADGDSTAKRREALRTIVPDVEIMPLANLNASVTSQRLVLTYGDIDTIGEHKQLEGLKDIAAYEIELYDKIRVLLQMGYDHVFLTTDHGYVITGLLDEADKQPLIDGVFVNDRFLTSNDDTINYGAYIRRNDPWPGGAYQFYARTDKPFRTKGPYGYAHGGFTPQECLIPIYGFHQENQNAGLKVTIANKTELGAVTGQYYSIKLHGAGDTANVFESERKVRLLFYDNLGHEQSAPMIITINANETKINEFSLSDNKMKVVVVDAETTEQLDSCTIKKSTSRDIDDLF